MGEQGAESIRAHMMRLERIHQGIANDVDRLKYIVKERMLELALSLTSPLKKGKEVKTLKQFWKWRWKLETYLIFIVVKVLYLMFKVFNLYFLKKFISYLKLY